MSPITYRGQFPTFGRVGRATAIALRGQFPTFGRVGRAIGGFLRKAAKVAIVGLLILAVVHGIATIIQGRRVEARLREIKNRGGVVSLSEFGKPKVPDAENAAVVYAKAFKALLVSPESESGYLVDFLKPSKRAADPKLWDRARQVLAANSEALGLVEQAVERPKCQFPTDWAAGFYATFPEYMHLRTLSRLLAAGAIIDAHDGRMDEAVRDIELSLKMSESLKNDPMIIGQLVRAALVRQSCSAVREVMSYGRISEEQAGRLDRILGTIRTGPDFTRAMQGERAIGLWAFEAVGRNPGDLMRLSNDGFAPSRPGAGHKLLGYLWRPVLYGDELVGLHHWDRTIALSRLPYREAASEYDREYPYQDRGMPRWAILSRILTPSLGRARMKADEAEAEASGSRIALALELYKQRNGSYPTTLDQLGRRFPNDPFSGRPFVYRREGKGFVLYSIGGNLHDDKAEPVQFVRGAVPAGAEAAPVPGGPTPGGEAGPTTPLGPNVSIAQSPGPGLVPSIPEPHYGDAPKYGDIVWRMSR